MKKYLTIVLAVLFLAGILPLAAASYDNNEFQRKSRALSVLAATAYEDGDYDAAIGYAQEAEKYASQSAAFIESRMARADAETALAAAKTRFIWAKGINAEKFYPAEYKAASAAIEAGTGFFTAEDYPAVKIQAEKAITALASVDEVTPLPAYYRVDSWDASKDCFWNIAANPAVYGDPFMWEKLYKANKKALKRPSNPNLLMPGMLVAIPSINGEYREGIYDPARNYEAKKK